MTNILRYQRIKCKDLLPHIYYLCNLTIFVFWTEDVTMD